MCYSRKSREINEWSNQRAAGTETRQLCTTRFSEGHSLPEELTSLQGMTILCIRSRGLYAKLDDGSKGKANHGCRADG